MIMLLFSEIGGLFICTLHGEAQPSLRRGIRVRDSDCYKPTCLTERIRCLLHKDKIFVCILALMLPAWEGRLRTP